MTYIFLLLFFIPCTYTMLKELTWSDYGHHKHHKQTFVQKPLITDDELASTFQLAHKRREDKKFDAATTLYEKVLTISKYRPTPIAQTLTQHSLFHLANIAQVSNKAQDTIVDHIEQNPTSSFNLNYVHFILQQPIRHENLIAALRKRNIPTIIQNYASIHQHPLAAYLTGYFFTLNPKEDTDFSHALICFSAAFDYSKKQQDFRTAQLAYDNIIQLVKIPSVQASALTTLQQLHQQYNDNNGIHGIENLKNTIAKSPIYRTHNNAEILQEWVNNTNMLCPLLHNPFVVTTLADYEYDPLKRVNSLYLALKHSSSPASSHYETLKNDFKKYSMNLANDDNSNLAHTVLANILTFLFNKKDNPELIDHACDLLSHTLSNMSSYEEASAFGKPFVPFLETLVEQKHSFACFTLGEYCSFSSKKIVKEKDHSYGELVDPELHKKGLGLIQQSAINNTFSRFLQRSGYRSLGEYYGNNHKPNSAVKYLEEAKNYADNKDDRTAIDVEEALLYLNSNWYKGALVDGAVQPSAESDPTDFQMPQETFDNAVKLLKDNAFNKKINICIRKHLIETLLAIHQKEPCGGRTLAKSITDLDKKAYEYANLGTQLGVPLAVAIKASYVHRGINGNTHDAEKALQLLEDALNHEDIYKTDPVILNTFTHMCYRTLEYKRCVDKLPSLTKNYLTNLYIGACHFFYQADLLDALSNPSEFRKLDVAIRYILSAIKQAPEEIPDRSPLDFKTILSRIILNLETLEQGSSVATQYKNIIKKMLDSRGIQLSADNHYDIQELKHILNKVNPGGKNILILDPQYLVH